MYDLARYDNLFPPAAWLFMLGLILLICCHLMIRYFEYEIDREVRQALSRNRHIDINYVAHSHRQAQQQWRDGRHLAATATLLGIVGWLISL